MEGALIDRAIASRPLPSGLAETRVRVEGVDAQAVSVARRLSVQQLTVVNVLLASVSCEEEEECYSTDVWSEDLQLRPTRGSYNAGHLVISDTFARAVI